MGKKRTKDMSAETASPQEKGKLSALPEAESAVGAELTAVKAPQAASSASTPPHQPSPRRDQTSSSRRSRRYREAATGCDKSQNYSPTEALIILKKINLTRFDPTVEVHLNLDADPKKLKETKKTLPGVKKIDGTIAHAKLGKLSEKPEVLTDKLNQLVQSAGKIKSIYLKTTMSPSLRIKA